MTNVEDMDDNKLVGLYCSSSRTKEVIAVMMRRGLLRADPTDPNPRFIRLSDTGSAIYQEFHQKLGWDMPIEHWPSPKARKLTAKEQREIDHQGVLYLRKLRADRDKWKADCRKARKDVKELKRERDDWGRRYDALHNRVMKAVTKDYDKDIKEIEGKTLYICAHLLARHLIVLKDEQKAIAEVNRLDISLTEAEIVKARELAKLPSEELNRSINHT